MEYDRLTAADYGALCAIWQQGVAGNLATFRDALPDYAVWNAAHDPGCRIGLRDAGRLCGFAVLTPHGGCRAYRGVAEISLYVDAAYCGRGLGGTLLDALTAAAVQHGYWTLEAVIIRENTASIRLFASRGFRTVGYRERIARTPDGVWHDTVILERRFADPIQEEHT